MNLKEVLLRSQGVGGESQNFENTSHTNSKSKKLKYQHKHIDNSTILIAALIFSVIAIVGIICAYNKVNENTHVVGTEVNHAEQSHKISSKPDDGSNVDKSAVKDDDSQISTKESSPDQSSVDQEGVVNINIASADELTMIKGIGPKTAEKIIEYRKTHGQFKTTAALMQVKGIGEKTFQKMKSQIKVK